MGPADREPEPPFGFGSVIVPDDASALEPDRQAWLAEQREARRRRRRHRWRRLVLTRRWDRFGLSGPIVAICLAVTTAVGALVVAFVPRPSTPPPAATALADVPFVSVVAAAPPPIEPSPGGVVGHRLPPARLDGDVRAVDAAALRPAVMVLVPASCGCAAAVRSVYRQAREFRLDVWLVGEGDGTAAPASGTELVALDEDAAAGGARFAADPAGTLGRALAAHGVTLLTIRSDGVVTALRRDLPLDPARLPALEPLFARLPGPTR